MIEILDCHSEEHAKGVAQYLRASARAVTRTDREIRVTWPEDTAESPSPSRAALPVTLWRGTRRVGIER